MPRNQLKRFPTALLRAGMAHFHPLARPTGRVLAERPEWLVEDIPAGPPAPPPANPTPSAEQWPV